MERVQVGHAHLREGRLSVDEQYDALLAGGGQADLAQNVHLDESTQEHLTLLAGDARIHLAANPAAHAAHVLLAALGDASVNQVLASNLTVPWSLLDQMTMDASLGAILAARPDVPAHVQEVLADEDGEAIRLALASNPALVPDVARKILALNEEYTTYYLARNPSLPADLQDTLLETGGWGVHRGLVENPSARTDILVKLSFLDSLGSHIPRSRLVEEMSARSVWDVDQGVFEEMLQGLDLKEATGLLEGWSGSMGDLREALELVNRST